AGLREATDDIEAEGIRRALARAETADLLIDLSDGCVSGDQRRLCVRSKSDLHDEDAEVYLMVSAVTGRGVTELLTAIADGIVDITATGDIQTTTARQEEALQHAAAALASAEATDDMVILAERLREASAALGRLTGRDCTDAVLDLVFGRFCIGK
ncbi:MAG: tRNA uridine-5-carboxymethylaminomethyl(34) synthesis GTPase MnmE, partial [Pacificimonas sp.]